jgi:hypothetical protein
MVREGSWNLVIAPLLDEYVWALVGAEIARAAARGKPFATHPVTGRSYAHPGMPAVDREVKRAMELADQLELNKPRNLPSEFAWLDGLPVTNERNPQ